MHVTSAAPPGRTGDATSAMSIGGAAVPVAVELRLAPPSRGAGATVARPRAQDPPDTLFARRCSLLL